MSVIRTLIGYIKGPKGDTGATGATGAQGPAGADGAPGVTDYASTTKAGLVRVGDDFNINASNGLLSIKNAFTEASTLANINTGESQATILGKIKKFMATLMPSNFLINTTNSTATDKALTANMGHTLAGDFATVQTSNTASKAYSVGEYLVLNGLLYRVTAAIANGGTITPGTNVTATTAGAQLKSLNDSLMQVDAYLVGDSVNTNGACVCRSSNDGSKIVADIYLPKRISVNVTGVTFGTIGYTQGYMGDGTAFTVSDITLDTLVKNNGAIRVICTPSKTLLSHAAGMVVISVPITFT